MVELNPRELITDCKQTLILLQLTSHRVAIFLAQAGCIILSQ